MELDIHSAADADTIAELAWLAEDMCFVMQAVKHPVAATLKVSLNGAPLGEGLTGRP